MNVNNYRKIVHAIMYFGSNKILLSQRLKPGAGYLKYGDPGGKVDKGEDILTALVREIREETDFYVNPANLKLIDCFINHNKKSKNFIFEIYLPESFYHLIGNPEPHKHTKWELFSIKKAKELDVLSSIKYYLERYT